MRVIVEQVSAIDHALVLGVPVVAGAGTLALTAGLGRPLVLTTLSDLRRSGCWVAAAGPPASSRAACSQRARSP